MYKKQFSVTYIIDNIFNKMIESNVTAFLSNKHAIEIGPVSRMQELQSCDQSKPIVKSGRSSSTYEGEASQED